MRPVIVAAVFMTVIGNALAQEYIWEERNGGLGGQSTEIIRTLLSSLIIGSQRGYILVSTDDGTTWEHISYRPSLDSIVSLTISATEAEFSCTRANGEVMGGAGSGRYGWYRDGTLPNPGMGLAVNRDEIKYAYDPAGGPTYMNRFNTSWTQTAMSCRRIVRAGNANLIGHDGTAVWVQIAGLINWESATPGNPAYPITYLHSDAGGVFIVRQSPDGPGMTAESFIHRTTDGGITWTDAGSQQGTDGIVTADSSGRIYFRTNMHSGYWETERGAWVDADMPANASNLYALPKGRVVAYSPAGLHLTTDTCRSWQTTRISMCTITGELAIRSPMFGYEGTLLLQSSDHCYYTSDGGFTWELYDYTEQNNVRLESMTDNISFAIEEPIIAGEVRKLVKEDYNLNWTPLLSFDVLSDVQGYTVGGWGRGVVIDDDTLALQSKQGNTWTYLPVPVSNGIYDATYDEDIYCGHPTGMYMSTDFGRSWKKTSDTPFTGTSLTTIHHYPANVLIQMGEPRYSLDHGATWEQMVTLLSPPVQRIKKADKDFWFTIVLTESGQLVAVEWPWQPFRHISKNVPFTNAIADFCLDADSVWAVGTEGGVYLGEHIYGTYTGTQAVQQPHSFSLAAPYPNPVAESATVRYTLESNGTVSLKLVDILGRTVALIDEGRREPGAHTATVNTAALRPGTYFLRMETAGGVMTKPVAVVR